MLSMPNTDKNILLFHWNYSAKWLHDPTHNFEVPFTLVNLLF